MLCKTCYYDDKYAWCGKGQDTDVVTDKCSHYEEGPQPEPTYRVRDSNGWTIGEPVWDVNHSLLWSRDTSFTLHPSSEDI